MGWATWERDRICALVADAQGEFWTMPLEPAGHRLRLNMRAPMAGEVRVEVEGAPGRSLEDCDPLSGDHLACPVTWCGQDDLGLTDGQPAVLHFRLRCAELFAIEFF